jgi:hypothetical protein
MATVRTAVLGVVALLANGDSWTPRANTRIIGVKLGAATAGAIHTLSVGSHAVYKHKTDAAASQMPYEDLPVLVPGGTAVSLDISGLTSADFALYIYTAG